MISAVIPMRYVLICIMACMPHTLWAISSPIGALTSQGKVTITTNGIPITLNSEEYAYYSTDGVITQKGTSAVLETPDGLKIEFSESSMGDVSLTNGVYQVNVTEGQLLVAVSGAVQVELFSNEQPVSIRDNTSEGNDLVLAADPDDKAGQTVSGVGIASVILLLATGTAAMVESNDTNFSTDNFIPPDDMDSGS